MDFVWHELDSLVIPNKIDLLMSEKVKIGEFPIQSHKNVSGVHPQYLGPKMEWNGTLLRKVNGSSSFCKGPRTSKV